MQHLHPTRKTPRSRPTKAALLIPSRACRIWLGEWRLALTTALFVAAAYAGVAWGSWVFLTRPLVDINRSDRLYCLALSMLWPAMLAGIAVMMLIPAACAVRTKSGR